jgi:hypothetical protein
MPEVLQVGIGHHLTKRKTRLRIEQRFRMALKTDFAIMRNPFQEGTIPTENFTH